MGLFSKAVLAVVVGLTLLAGFMVIPNTARAHAGCMRTGGWVESAPGASTALCHWN